MLLDVNRRLNFGTHFTVSRARLIVGFRVKDIREMVSNRPFHEIFTPEISMSNSSLGFIIGIDNWG